MHLPVVFYEYVPGTNKDGSEMKCIKGTMIGLDLTKDISSAVVIKPDGSLAEVHLRFIKVLKNEEKK